MSATVVMHGIENCDQVRKARNWLRAHQVSIEFRDLRRDGVSRETLERWLGRVPWDALLNRRGQAWRRLDAARRHQVVDQASAIDAMLADPLLVRRPVLEAGEHLMIGFSETAYGATFAEDRAR